MSKDLDEFGNPEVFVERWWVIFGEAKGEPWPWSRAQHVMALTDRAGVTLVCDPLWWRQIIHMSAQPVSRWLEKFEGQEVLTLAKPAQRAQNSWRNRLPGLLTCSSAIAYTMGLDRRPWFPSGLRAELLRLGAERI